MMDMTTVSLFSTEATNSTVASPYHPFGSKEVSSATEEVGYGCDLEESLNRFNWAELVPALIVYSLTFLLGVTGNVLIIIATTSCRRRSGVRACCSCPTLASASASTSHSAPGRGLEKPSPNNVFLAFLASADLLLILICIPVKMASLFSYTWTMGEFLCKFVYYMQNVSTICSVLTLTAISLERYYAIVHPMKSKYTCTVGQANKLVMAMWVASLLLAVPILFVQVRMRVGVKIPSYWCLRDIDNVQLWRLYEVYMLSLVLILPTCVMGGVHAYISWEIWKVMRRRYHMTGGMRGINPPADDQLGSNGSPKEKTTTMASKSMRLSSKKGTSARRFRKPRCRINAKSPATENKTARKVITMLVTLVVLFVVCWAPVLIDNVLISYHILPSMRDDNSSLRHMENAFHLLSYFNSCINPIVYGFMSKSFRVSLHKVLCKCCQRRRWESSEPKMHPSTTSKMRTTPVRFTDTRTTELLPIHPASMLDLNHVRSQKFREVLI